MKLAYLAFIAFLAGLTFLVLTIADQERQARAGVESIPRSAFSWFESYQAASASL
jgi:hypothetical protein